MKYRVTIHRTITHAAEIEIEAATYEDAYFEAHRKADQDGSTMVFPERYPAEYDVVDIERIL